MRAQQQIMIILADEMNELDYWIRQNEETDQTVM